MAVVDTEPSSSTASNSADALLFPSISTTASLTNLLSSSTLADPQPTNMASQTADDATSIDGSVSSITDSQWDVVDEASATSEDGGGISRQPTPFSDHPSERLRLDLATFGGNDTSSESQVHSSRHTVEFKHSRKDSTSDPPDTAKRTMPFHGPYRDPADFDFCRQDQERHIRFAESGQDNEEKEVSFHLTDFEGSERVGLSTTHKVNDSTHLRGTLRQAMGHDALRLCGPFKILYHGSGAAKAAILEKIGTALAAHLSNSTTSVMDSSRVTVVPISAFSGNNIPDVVLIDSMGIDMNIEECTSASKRGESFGGTMSLTINNQKSIESSWNPLSNTYDVSGGYQLPHLTIFSVTDDDSLPVTQTRARAWAFLERHEVPRIVISSSPGWEKPSLPFSINLKSPHLCLEYVDMYDKGTRIIKRLPVDLNSFLNIDAGQLNRNLASLTASDGPDSSLPQTRGPRRFFLSRGRHDTAVDYGKAAISITKLPIVLLSVATIIFVSVILQNFRGDVLNTPAKNHSVRQPDSKTAATLSSLTTPSVAARTAIVEREPRLVALSEQPEASELAALLMETRSVPNKSEKFQVQIVGDSHVVLRPPVWFNTLKKTPKLHFKILRDQKEVQFEFSTLFDGVFALRLPPEDAHGILNVSVWTAQRPRIQENLRVDFGNPWMKVKTWWNSAWVMADQVKGELGSAQDNMSKAYRLANRQLERAEQSLREVETASLGSLRQTTKTAQMLLEHSKRLSRGLSKNLSSKMQRQQLRLQKDIAAYSKLMTAALTEQIGQMRGAAAGLDPQVLRQKIQTYRERNFRQAQIKMLHTWWRLRGSQRPIKRNSPGGHRGCLRSHRTKDGRCPRG